MYDDNLCSLPCCVDAKTRDCEMLRDVDHGAPKTFVTRHPPENKRCVFIRFGANTALLS